MNATVIAFLVLYYVVVLGIGFWAMRQGASEDLEGFLLGGRDVGPLVTALTLQSTSMSGYMFLGAGSLAYTTGYWSLWFAAGDIGGGVLNLSVIGRRMRKLSQVMGSLTAIEYLEGRYPSSATRLIAASLSVFLLAFYVLAQFIAGGKGMALVTGLDYSWALLIALSIIIIYTFLGGYLAVAYTDFFQSLVMIVGVVWILAAALAHVGGFTAANHALAAIDPTILSIWGRGLGFEGQWGVVAGAVLVFSAGYMGWPHVVTRHMAMRRPATARLAGAYATGWNLLFVSSPYLVGILAILILPSLDDPELALIEVARTLLPPAATGIVMAAIMAAIMSTADSLLLQTGSIASRDLYERFINPKASERQMVLVSRLLILAIGVIGYFVALVEPPAVAFVVIFATSVLGSAFAPAFVCAVWWKKANTPGAIASMVAGAVTSVAWELAGLATATTLAPVTAGLAASTLAIVVVSLATQNMSPVPKHILGAMEETARVGPIPEEMPAMFDFTLRPEAEEIESMIREGKK
ncbi:MAG TPA: sodium/proline symporter [Vicinamibacterales bacterium]|nr:sodium/proline symporter [Vicinamibacterales bacterium]